MNIINVNSSPDIWEEAKRIEGDVMASRLSFLLDIWEKVPVFLCDVELMDKIFPEEYRRLLVLPEGDNEVFDPEDPVGFWDRMKGKTVIVPREPRGVYLHTPEQRIRGELSVKYKIKTTPGPMIFLCGERILGHFKVTLPMKNPFPPMFPVLFAKVYFHELGHAYMATDQRYVKFWESWERVVEESTANAIAYSKFDVEEEKTFLREFISGRPGEPKSPRSPTEYRGYPVLYLLDTELEGIASAWRIEGLGFPPAATTVRLVVGKMLPKVLMKAVDDVRTINRPDLFEKDLEFDYSLRYGDVRFFWKALAGEMLTVAR